MLSGFDIEGDPPDDRRFAKEGEGFSSLEGEGAIPSPSSSSSSSIRGPSNAEEALLVLTAATVNRQQQIVLYSSVSTSLHPNRKDSHPTSVSKCLQVILPFLSA